MIKILFLKEYYNESYVKIANRIKSDDVCQCFLGYPDDYPCKSTIWNFNELITVHQLYNGLWDYFKINMNLKGYHQGTEVMQDSSFLEADKGHKKVSYPSRR